MAYSKADLRNRVLRDMGALDIAEAASAEDAEVLDNIVQQSLEELEDENLIIFDTTQGETIENIPGRVFSALADFVRFHAMPSYGHPKDDALWQAALRRLRRSVAPEADDVPTAAKYY